VRACVRACVHETSCRVGSVDNKVNQFD